MCLLQHLSGRLVRKPDCSYHEIMSWGKWCVLQSSNRCLADACGAMHCDYFNSLSSEPKTQTATCKAAVVDKNRHSCEVGRSPTRSSYAFCTFDGI